MRSLFTGLFDDAALFPPGDAPMAAAVPAHRELRTRLGDLVGPFVVPAARLGELAEHLGVGEPIDVSLIAAAGDLPAAAARVTRSPGLVLAAVEIPVATDATAAREAIRVLDDVLPADVPAAVELPRSPARDGVLDVLAGTPHRAKLRTGGVRAALFPPPEELAATLAAVEVPVTTAAAAAREAVRVLDDVLPAVVPAAVELPRTEARDEVLDVLAGTRHRAKLRTGGLRADLFPAAEELAATLAACIARGVALKCTAGLHSAVRHTDPATGFAHHGFLNVLVAVSALTAGAPASTTLEHLRDTDAGHVVAALRTWTPERAARARAAFTSFGTCSVLEPVDDLVRLRLLPSPERISA